MGGVGISSRTKQSSYFPKKSGDPVKTWRFFKTPKVQQIKGNECLHQANLLWDSCNSSSWAKLSKPTVTQIRMRPGGT